MDYYLTTYHKDYKWPVTYLVSETKRVENEQKMREVQLKDAEPHMLETLVKPIVESNVEFGNVIPAQPGASPVSEASKYDQPNAYLQKLYIKYPYLYNIMKFTTTDDMAKRVMSEKYKTSYQMEYSREDDYSTLVDVIKHGEQPQDVPDKTKAPGICLPEGIPPPKCHCAKGLAFSPCQCAKEVPIRRVAWKPAPISKIPQFPREKKKKKKTEESNENKPKLAGKGSSAHFKPYSSEYKETISRIGWIIVKDKLLYKETIQAVEDADKKTPHPIKK